MVVTNDARIAKTCRSLRNQGRDEDSGWLRHERLGFNYRLSELHCALGLAQLERIDELLAARARVAAAYSRELRGMDGVRLPVETPDAKRSWFVYVIRLECEGAHRVRDLLIAKLRERSIGCQAYFPPIHEQPYLQDGAHRAGPFLPQTRIASQSCVALPFFASMTVEQVREVCAAVREILEGAGSDLTRAPGEDSWREPERARVVSIGTK